MSSLFCYIFNFLKIFGKALPRARETLVLVKPRGYKNILEESYLIFQKVRQGLKSTCLERNRLSPLVGTVRGKAKPRRERMFPLQLQSFLGAKLACSALWLLTRETCGRMVSGRFSSVHSRDLGRVPSGSLNFSLSVCPAPFPWSALSSLLHYCVFSWSWGFLSDRRPFFLTSSMLNALRPGLG